MEKAGIIDRVDSPWSAPSRFVRKKNNSLRLTHTFCPINNATIKSNYPMRRVEPILNNLMQPRFSMFWWTDAANGYWAVPVWPPHVFKTAFSCALGQFAYKRMGQGLTGAPMTYSRLKDLMAGPIPEPHAEPAISGITLDGSAAFEYFVDDDMGAAVSFDDQLRFLHDSYFPRIAWAKLTLSPAKSAFFMPRVEGLGFVGGPLGLRPSADKVKAIHDYPVPTNEAKIDKFLFMTTYIRKFIPGRAEYARIMKEAVIQVAESIPRSGLREEVGKGGFQEGQRVKGGKRKISRKTIGFEWRKDQQDAFDAIKHAIINNACWGGDPTFQYHLSTDASSYAYGGILFQLPTLPAGTILDKTNKDHMRIVQFISKAFSDPETRYHTTEREGLAVIRCLEEVRWLVMQAMDIPVMVYTHHKSLLLILDGSLAKESPNAARSARIDRWQLRLAEYNLKFEHIPGGENKIADGLSRLPVSALEVGVAGREDDLVETLVAEAMEVQEEKESGGEEKEQAVAGKRNSRRRVEKKVRKEGLEKMVEEQKETGMGHQRDGRTGKEKKMEGRGMDERVEKGTIRRKIEETEKTKEAARDSGKEKGKKWDGDGQRRVEVMVVGKGRDGEMAVEGCESGQRREGVKEGGKGGVKDGQRSDGVKEKGVETEEMRRKVKEGKLRDRWKKWLDSDWYGSVVEYRLFGRDGGDGSRAMRKRMERKAADFRLIDAKGAAPRLAYVERDGRQSWCIFPDRVNDVLTHAHDCHGHFADAITLKQLIGKFYWPTRAKDTPVFCRTCQACQYFGPRKPSQIQKPILHLQPFDMIGIDFLGPFNPVCDGTSSKYVILVVDYCSRFAWARAVEANDGEAAVKFLMEEVVKVFGWPSAVYSDNGSHFVQGDFAALLKANGIKHFPAPKSHPSSVGLIERYVQLILYGLRRHTLLVDRGKFLWDRFLPLVINNLNDRVLRVHGYTPSQLLFGCTPRRSGWDVTPTQEHVAEGLAQLYQNDPYFNTLTVDDGQVALRFAAIDEMRNRAVGRLSSSHQSTVRREKLKTKWTAPQMGDLVLLRNMSLDGQHGHKLAARWEGPYLLDDIHPEGRAGRLRDIQSGELVKIKASGKKERVHLDDLKVFVPRADRAEIDVVEVSASLKDWTPPEFVADTNLVMMG
jgi:hypothetical protein